jgi:TRAF3-interacting protein 1
MGDLEPLMERVKELMGGLISKPKMSDKLLSKPPFRFLHDTISSVSSTTGFAEGLFSEGELDSAAITDKHAKTAYLDKIFNFVGVCKVCKTIERLQLFVCLLCVFFCLFIGRITRCSLS